MTQSVTFSGTFTLNLGSQFGEVTCTSARDGRWYSFSIGDVDVYIGAGLWQAYANPVGMKHGNRYGICFATGCLDANRLCDASHIAGIVPVALASYSAHLANTAPRELTITLSDEDLVAILDVCGRNPWSNWAQGVRGSDVYTRLKEAITNARKARGAK